MADSRSLLASLTGLVSLCLSGCEGAAGGGRGGGGGPGGGGAICGPGGGTGGSGYPGPMCTAPLFSGGGGKPNAVWADGMGGPWRGGGGTELFNSRKIKISATNLSNMKLHFETSLFWGQSVGSSHTLFAGMNVILIWCFKLVYLDNFFSELSDNSKQQRW